MKNKKNTVENDWSVARTVVHWVMVKGLKQMSTTSMKYNLNT